jgi:hypothetical protein
MTKGGAFKPVVVITDNDLRSNGGRYVLRGGPALPVSAVELNQIAANENIGGGKAQAIYVIRDDDLGGRFKRGGGDPLPVTDLARGGAITNIGRSIGGRVAQPVYVVDGSADSLVVWLLRDDFWPTTRAAGAIDGTFAEPGPGQRDVVDGEGVMTISGGALQIGTQATASFTDEVLLYRAFPRVTGRVLIASPSGNLVAGRQYIAPLWSSASPPAAAGDYEGGFYWFTSAPEGSAWIGDARIGIFTQEDIEYFAAIPVRANGFFFFVKGGALANWTLVWIDESDTSDPLYPGLAGFTAAETMGTMRVPAELWLPVPLISDGFGGAVVDADGLGHLEGVDGSLGAGGSSVGAWTDNDGTWQNVAGVCNASALSGGLAISTLSVSTPDAVIDLEFTSRAGGEGGLIIRYADSSNYLRAFHDGVNAQLEEVVAGVPNSLISVITAFGAGDVIRVITDGVEYRLYYDDVLIGVTTAADASLQGNIRFGRYTTNVGNTFDNFVLYSRGTSGEYARLDDFTQGDV